ncbi:LysR substrate-binding domain-containing protein [Rhizobium halophytocola]|nr:LysR substrate-binding domain-containing protein [Rhizobium halophytocola]
MTIEQLVIFVAVAEREHLTRAAEAIRLTPSAVSSSIKKLEAFYGVALFNRVGRRIELTGEGQAFLAEARATVARIQAAELMLSEMGGLERGSLSIHASQTVASYWLPPLLMRFHARYPGIDLSLTIGNTASVAHAVREGIAEIGFVEGRVDDGALSVTPVADDALQIVTAPDHAWADGRLLKPKDLLLSTWVLRETGSGTRQAFEQALLAEGIDLQHLKVVLTFPSNEAVLSATRAGPCAAVVSGIAAESQLHEGLLVKANYRLPTRRFTLLRHKERRASRATEALIAISRER